MNKKKKILTGAISIVVGVVISLGILKQLDVIDRDSVIGKVFYKETANKKQQLPESDEGYDEVSEEEGKHFLHLIWKWGRNTEERWYIWLKMKN